MISVETNILAHSYCEDPDNPEAKRQRWMARRVVVDSPALSIPLTGVLEVGGSCALSMKRAGKRFAPC